MNKCDSILADIDFNMNKAISTFNRMISDYHKPTDFIADVDALIQSLRNFTFFLQAKKEDIHNFDAWYAPWQDSMRKNPYMKFIVDMRNSIVKKGINTAKSHATILIFADYNL